MQGWFEIKEDKLKLKASKEGLLHPRLQYGIELMGYILDEASVKLSLFTLPKRIGLTQLYLMSWLTLW